MGHNDIYVAYGVFEESHNVFVLVFICISNMKRSVGLDMPTIEVRFEHLYVEAEAYVGSRALPTIFNFSVNMLEVYSLSFRFYL